MTYMFSSIFTGDPKTPEVGFELSNHMDSQWIYGWNEFRAKVRRERKAEVRSPAPESYGKSISN